MQILIDIDDDIAQGIIDGNNDEPRNIVRSFQATIADAIKNGKALPKGHGKLKDENEIFECIRNRVENLKNDRQFIKYRKDIDLLGTIPHIRNEVKTVIEADTTESEVSDANTN